MRLLPIVTSLCLLQTIVTKSYGNVDITSIKQKIKTVEKEYGLPQNLLHAIIEVESSFQIKARQGMSYGLGQITLDTGKAFCNLKHRSQLFDYRYNVTCSATVLRWQIDRFNGSTYYAIAAYNSGTPFICNGSHYVRDLGYKVEKLKKNFCKRKERGLVFNREYVSNVMKRWKLKNKIDKTEKKDKVKKELQDIS